MYGCHGQSLVMHGVALASHWSATGLTVSGVEAAVTDVDLVVVDEVAGDLASAGCESDWLSSSTMVTGCFLPSPQTHTVADGFGRPVDAVLVGHAERGQTAGQRRDETDLELAARLPRRSLTVVVAAGRGGAAGGGHVQLWW